MMQTWKKVLIVATLPALVSGLGILGPEVYHQIEAPLESLSYRVKPLTTRADAPESRVGYSIKVVNDGDTVLRDVVATMHTKARIKKVKILEETGIVPTVNSKSRPYEVSVKALHPDEEFTVVVTFAPQVKGSSFRVAVASGELEAKRFMPEGWIPKKALRLQATLLRIEEHVFISAGTSALSVFVILVPLLLMLLATRHRPVGNTSSKQATTTGLLFYVASRAGLAELVSQHELKETPEGYRRFTDLVFAAAKGADGKERQKYIATLRALLLVDHAETKTRELIERSVKRLEGKDCDEGSFGALKARASKLSASLEQRDAIDEVLETLSENTRPPIKLADKQLKPAAVAG